MVKMVTETVLVPELLRNELNLSQEFKNKAHYQ